MLASLAGACLATSRATEPVTGNGPLPPPPSSPAGPAAPAPRPPRSFTVVATGDIAASAATAGAAAGRPDYRRPLGPVLPLVSGADLAICHLETPLARPEPALALAELGFDTCSTASGHALDAGGGGVARTLDSLDRAGLRHAGTARSAAEAARPAIMNVKGVRVAQLSYVTARAAGATGRAPGRPHRTMPWLVGKIDPGRILSDARRARRAGASVVIVSLAWGTVNRHAATPGQIALAQRLLAATDVDLIVGTGAQVVQPFGRAVNGKFVAYGMGHLLAAPRGGDGRATGTADTEGIITRFTFTHVRGAWKVTRAEFVPTYVDHGPPRRVLNVTAALADPRLPPARRRLLQGVLHRTMGIVYSRGAAPVLAR